MFLLFLEQNSGQNRVYIIYIPICFYYFCDNVQNRHLSCHSNMFLLFPSMTERHISISCAFTFQYVSIISSTMSPSTLSVQNLHSNMFLLFHSHFIDLPCDSGIYIPICFYYFFADFNSILIYF